MDSKKVFILKAILWGLFSAVLPIIFIGWRYSLFKKVGKLQVSGWGLIAILILFLFFKALVRYIRAGFVEYSFLKQVLSGILKVILPIGVLLCLCLVIRSKIEYFIQALECTLICETVGIFINPFPKWVWNKTQGRYENLIDMFANKINNKKGE